MKRNAIKYLAGLLTVILLRLVPHPPNVEPIMSTMMPFSKKWGWKAGALFSLLAILSFDIITRTLGMWTLMTAGTYTALGIAAGLYFKKRKGSIRNYVGFAVIGTLIYDGITGIGTGMLFFNQSFLVTLAGQIPFTLYHLGGNIAFAIIISPLLYRWVVDNPQMETQPVLNRLRAAVGMRDFLK